VSRQRKAAADHDFGESLPEANIVRRNKPPATTKKAGKVIARPTKELNRAMEMPAARSEALGVAADEAIT
jgi:hypothetical protein